MIELTQEKREDLTKFAMDTLNSLNGIEPENPNQYDDCLSEYTQMCMEIALASLTAEPVAYMTYKGYLLHAADPKLSEYSDPEPLYDAPPVSEINFPGISALVDHQGCLPAVRDIAIWDFAISEVKRLNGWGE